MLTWCYIYHFLCIDIKWSNFPYKLLQRIVSFDNIKDHEIKQITYFPLNVCKQ